MSHPYKSSPQGTTHHVVAVGVFFGLVFLGCKILEGMSSPKNGGNLNLRHVRNQRALAGYAQSLTNQSAAEVKLFHFSEQEDKDTKGLDTRKLIEALYQNASQDPCEVSILFPITASSSFLFFNQEHNPRHVELCSELKSFHLIHPFDKVNFITCPTTREAMQAPDLNQPCYGEFAEFATMADTWWDFKSNQHVDPQSIQSLILKKVEQSRTAAQSVSMYSPGGIALATLVVALGAILLLYQSERLYSFEKQIEAQHEAITRLEKQFQLRGPAQTFESRAKEIHALNRTSQNLSAEENATTEKLQKLETQLQEQNATSEKFRRDALQKLETQFQEQNATSEKFRRDALQKLETQFQEQNATSEKFRRDALQKLETQLQEQNATSEKFLRDALQKLETQLQEQNATSEKFRRDALQKLATQLQEQNATSEKFRRDALQKLETQLQEQNATSEKFRRDAQLAQTHIENLESSLKRLNDTEHRLQMTAARLNQGIADCVKLLSQTAKDSYRKLGPSVQHCFKNLVKQNISLNVSSGSLHGGYGSPKKETRCGWWNLWCRLWSSL